MDGISMLKDPGTGKDIEVSTSQNRFYFFTDDEVPLLTP
jgi:hypothetical protein